MSVKKALEVIGFSHTEALIIEYMLDRTSCSISEIIDGTEMSRGTVYKAMSKLVSSGKITKTRNRPVIYSITRGLTSEIKRDFSTFSKSFISRISHKGVIERRKVAIEIFDSFERNGFAIRNAPILTSKRYDLQLFDKIADAEYSIAISIIDKNKKIPFTHEYIIGDIFYSQSRRLNSIVSFLFIHNDRKDFEKLYKKLKMVSIKISRRNSEYSSFPEGIEGTGFYVFKTTTDLQESITSQIRDIRERHLLVRNLVSKLKDKAAENHELIQLSQEHIKYIEDFFVRSQPYFSSKGISKKLSGLSDPVLNIKNRESRNLDIVRRLFSEYEVRINQSIDRIESRNFLPTVDSIKKEISEFEQFTKKFKPIEYELNYLRQGIFRFTMELARAGKRGSIIGINPFLFTEPYEKIPFYVNQKKIEKAASILSNNILEDLPGFFQVVTGEAGIGKTHCLKYIYSTIMEKNRIKTLYIDCPVGYDLLAGVFQELTQEVLYPKTVASAIKNLRRVTPTVARDFIRVLSSISEILKKVGYSGVLIILDELENSLPYIIRARKEVTTEKEYRMPIALRQIRELLTAELSIPNMGFVISCRSPILPMFENAMRMKNFNKFVYTPEKLGAKELMELVNHRYDVWNVQQPVFTEKIMREIIQNTNGNTRGIIKYCRALFEFGKRNKIEKLQQEDIKKIGAIPMFKF